MRSCAIDLLHSCKGGGLTMHDDTVDAMKKASSFFFTFFKKRVDIIEGMGVYRGT